MTHSVVVVVVVAVQVTAGTVYVMVIVSQRHTVGLKTSPAPVKADSGDSYLASSLSPLIMVALWNRADHYIFILFLSSFLFPRLISAAGDWMSTILQHVWCGLSANLECRSQMCCTWLVKNTGRKNDAKNRHLGTIAQFGRATPSQVRHVSTIGKKLVKQQYILHMSPQYGELRPTSG